MNNLEYYKTLRDKLISAKTTANDVKTSNAEGIERATPDNANKTYLKALILESKGSKDLEKVDRAIKELINITSPDNETRKALNYYIFDGLSIEQASEKARTKQNTSDIIKSVKTALKRKY